MSLGRTGRHLDALSPHLLRNLETLLSHDIALANNHYGGSVEVGIVRRNRGDARVGKTVSSNRVSVVECGDDEGVKSRGSGSRRSLEISRVRKEHIHKSIDGKRDAAVIYALVEGVLEADSINLLAGKRVPALSPFHIQASRSLSQ
jgi:hypothetical protein